MGAAPHLIRARLLRLVRSAGTQDARHVEMPDAYGNVHKKDLVGLGEEWPWGVAGDEDFDPLGLYGLLGNDAVGRFTMRELELNHGRVAMLAVLSYVMLESVTHVPVVQLTPF